MRQFLTSTTVMALVFSAAFAALGIFYQAADPFLPLAIMTCGLAVACAFVRRIMAPGYGQ